MRCSRHHPPSLVVFTATLTLGALAFACGGGTEAGSGRSKTATAPQQTQPLLPETVTVQIDGLAVQAELAQTPEERAQGLSERDSLAAGAGMLFVFETERQPSFWMRGMRFPLDFLWISAGLRVVDRTEDVPPPDPETPDADLPRYVPDAAVLYVLEVNAGVIREAGVEIGDTVIFEPDIAFERAPAMP